MRAIKLPNIDYHVPALEGRWSSPACSSASAFSRWRQGLNLGLDFTGGTVIEVGYQEPTDLAEVRAALDEGGFESITVQHFGSTRDVLLRIPPVGEANDADLSQRVFDALAAARGRQGGTAAGGVRRPPGRQGIGRAGRAGRPLSRSSAS